MHHRTIALALGIALMSPALAAAQAPPAAKGPGSPTKEVRDPDACSNTRATVGKGGEMNVRKPQGGNLSDQLARSNGVICPPQDVDPDMKAPTPQGGPMPVIPPPGSPGGNSQAQPK
jgi:hypothetical protein